MIFLIIHESKSNNVKGNIAKAINTSIEKWVISFNNVKKKEVKFILREEENELYWNQK